MIYDTEERKRLLLLNGLAPEGPDETVIEVDRPEDLPLDNARPGPRSEVTTGERPAPLVFYYHDYVGRLVAQRNTALSVNQFIDAYWVDRRKVRFVVAER
jgi:hypothetical protein